MNARIDAADVRANLRPEVVMDRFGVDYRRAGDEFRFGVCPACGPRTRPDALAVNIETGLWKCHVCAGAGDVLSLLAGLAELDLQGGFQRVLELGAELANVQPVEVPRPPRHRAPARDWSHECEDLARRHPDGERYLIGRGIDVAELVERDVIRFGARGQPTLPLMDLASGAIVGLQSRSIDGSGPKVKSWLGSQVAGSALWGRVAELDSDGCDIAVVVEGLVDTFVAHLAWPGCAIFGAPGAGQLEAIARAVAPRVAAVGGWLLLVADDDSDGAGVNGAIRAARAAIAAGLNLADRDALLDGGRQLRLVDIGAHHDLAEAWAAGWRWTWPALPRGSS